MKQKNPVNRWVIIFLWWCLMCLPGAGNGLLYGQNISFLGLGFNQTFGDMGDANVPIARYNAGVDAHEEFRELGSLNGFTAGMRIGGKRITGEIAFVGRTNQRKSSLSDNPGDPVTQTIRLRYRMNTVDIGAGINLLKKPQMALTIGNSISMGRINILRKYASNSSFDNQYFPIYNDLALGNTVWLQWVATQKEADWTPAIMVQPYYHFSWINHYLFDFNRALNPQTFANDSDQIAARGSHFGIRISLGIARLH